MNRSPLQVVASLVGVVFLVVGIAGFSPGLTANLYDGLDFAGHHGTAQLLGIFDVSVLHNLVHLLFGVAGLVLARSWSGARAFLVGGGVVYLVLWLYGFLVDLDSSANFVPVNNADNWLHLLLGVGMIGSGLVLSWGVAPRERIADSRV